MNVHLLDGPCEGLHEVQDNFQEGGIFVVECVDGAASVAPGQKSPLGRRVKAWYRLTSPGPPATANVLDEEYFPLH
jgi:hypothetical protein